ncbi:MAG: hypothetical protein JRF51_02100 [Deltaproteobacteria bacterium]|nr:hypothetical protein [Deltaproteobacteria bacterium]
MEKDFHYYLIYAVSKITGHEKAHTIALSSQFVDDNNEGQFSIDERPAPFPEKIRSNGGHYYPIMTQSLSTRSLDPYVQKYVYVPFHFIPGDNSVVIDGKRNPFSTTPGSPNARVLLKKALASDNPYRIGIALHSYADTWSHQNFTGLHEDWNSIYPWYNLFKSIVPNIGHAEAGHSPDVISDDWTDNRLDQRTIINRKRALEATGEIYKAMRRKSGYGPYWKGVKKDLRRIINARDYDDRKKKIEDLLTESGLERAPKYSKDDWIDRALDRRGEEIVMRDGFEETDWYQFHQAAKAQFALVLDLTKGL